MAFDFPNSPTIGDIVQSPSASYRWDGAKWTSSSSSTPIWLPISGGTLTGPLILSRDPLAFMEAATKQYVDNAGVVTFNGRKGVVTLTSSDETGALTFTPYNATNPAGYQTAAQVGAQITTALAPYRTAVQSDAAYVNTSGDTLTGPLLLSRDPLGATEAATKRYVDSLIGASGVVSFNGRQGAVTLTTNDVTQVVDAVYVNVSGDTMTGSLTAANLYAPSGEVHCVNVMASGGLFYIASGYYLQRGSDGAWRFVEGGTINSTLDTAGNLTVRGGLYGAYVHSTGDIRADSTLWAGGSGYNAWGSQIAGVLGGGAYWIGFNWDGTNVPAYANGAYACTLVSSTWVSNNFYPAGTSDGRYLYKGGDTCTGGLTVNGRLRTADAVMCVSGVFYVADNPAYYLARNSNDGNWRFVENNTINFTVAPGGDASNRGNFYTTELHAAGNSFVPNICTTATANPDNWSWFVSGGWLYQRWSGNSDIGIGNPSDERIKHDIAPCRVDCLDLVCRIPLHEFRYRKMAHGIPGDADPDAELIPVGFVAQRVADVFPSGVMGHGVVAPKRLDGRDSMLLMSIDANRMMAALVGSVQQLTARVEAIERIIT
jgi:hypothetical protein